MRLIAVSKHRLPLAKTPHQNKSNHGDAKRVRGEGDRSEIRLAEGLLEDRFVFLSHAAQWHGVSGVVTKDTPSWASVHRNPSPDEPSFLSNGCIRLKSSRASEIKDRLTSERSRGPFKRDDLRCHHSRLPKERLSSCFHGLRRTQQWWVSGARSGNRPVVPCQMTPPHDAARGKKINECVTRLHSGCFCRRCQRSVVKRKLKMRQKAKDAALWCAEPPHLFTGNPFDA